jgi:hypothetical protein
VKKLNPALIEALKELDHTLGILVFIGLVLFSLALLVTRGQILLWIFKRP